MALFNVTRRILPRAASSLPTLQTACYHEKVATLAYITSIFVPFVRSKRVFWPLDLADVGLRVLAKNRPNCATDEVTFGTIGSLGLVSRFANVARAIKGSYHLGP